MNNPKILSPTELIELLKENRRIKDAINTDEFAGIAGRLIHTEYKGDDQSALAILKTINEMAYEEFEARGISTPPSVKSILVISSQIMLYE